MPAEFIVALAGLRVRLSPLVGCIASKSENTSSIGQPSIVRLSRSALFITFSSRCLNHAAILEESTKFVHANGLDVREFPELCLTGFDELRREWAACDITGSNVHDLKQVILSRISFDERSAIGHL